MVRPRRFAKRGGVMGVVVPLPGPHAAAGAARRGPRRGSADDLSRGGHSEGGRAAVAEHSQSAGFRRGVGADDREVRMNEAGTARPTMNVARMNVSPWSLRSTASAVARGW